MGLYDDYYATLYADNGQRLRDIYPKSVTRFLILPDDPFKIRWEMFISVILIFTAVVTPYRIAFTESDELEWQIINYFIDATFVIDIFICFISAFEDENEELVYQRCEIAKSYLKSWFFLDLFSILPISEIMDSGDFASLARIARLPKLYRLIRMFKLIRLLKIIKERNNISKYLNEVLKVGVAVERLVFFCFMFIILVHITACFWVIIASIEEDDNNLIMWNGFSNMDT